MIKHGKKFGLKKLRKEMVKAEDESKHPKNKSKDFDEYLL